MKFYITVLCSIALAVAAAAGGTNEVTKVVVRGDRVSLRVRPDVSSELLGRTRSGEELVFVGRTNGWVSVQAPLSLDYWVAAQYIDAGNRVTPEKLNVRSGPSLNYTVVGVLNEGDRVERRSVFNDWLKIVPPAGCRVWISDKFVEIVEPDGVALVPLPEAEPVPVETVEQNAEAVADAGAGAEEPEAKPEAVAVRPPEVIPARPEAELKPLMLVMDETRAQGIYDEIPGVLRRANPGLYKLVLIIGDLEEPICLVRGRESQLDKLLNRSLLIKGRKYWAKGVALPVLQPDEIHKDPIIRD